MQSRLDLPGLARHAILMTPHFRTPQIGWLCHDETRKPGVVGKDPEENSSKIRLLSLASASPSFVGSASYAITPLAHLNRVDPGPLLPLD